MLERKLQLVRIEDVEHDHVGAAIAEMLEAVEDVARDRRADRTPAPPCRACAPPRARSCSGLATLVRVPILQPLERQQHRAQVPGARARRQQRRNAVVERDQAERIALPMHQVGERAGEIRRVLQLGDLAGAVAHRSADVEQQVAREVGFLFVLLDEVLVGAREHLPVERGEIVAGQILPVLRELDAESLVRTAMQAGQEALDDRPRLEIDRAEPRDDRRIEIA